MKRVVLLTGERAVGKTAVCQRVVEEARERGYCCSGLLSPGVLEGEEKRGIQLVDVSTGEARLLAMTDDGTADIRWGKYRFLSSTLQWGTLVLKAALPSHLLVVDELGPLELEKGEGLVTALELLDGGSFSLALIVVRPELVAALAERLKGLRPKVIEVTEQTRDMLPQLVMSILHEAVNLPDLPSQSHGGIVAD
jgi:nucleoside-triphosphatase THEP1